jgi:hypothetical protein
VSVTDARTHPVVYLDDDDMIYIGLEVRRRMEAECGVAFSRKQFEKMKENPAGQRLIYLTWVVLRELLEKKQKDLQ